jgi:hypothetical protein
MAHTRRYSLRSRRHAADSTEAFRLLNLPPELWSRICYFATVSPDAIILSPYGSSKQRAVQPPLTRVCKVLRVEALRLFYSENTFVVRDTPYTDDSTLLFWSWQVAIRQANRQAIRNLFLQITKQTYISETELWNEVEVMYCSFKGNGHIRQRKLTRVTESPVLENRKS